MSTEHVGREGIFTFQPKVSSASTRIAEKLGSNFMSRQQQHLERQRRNTEQASLHFHNRRELSPIHRGRKLRDIKNEDGIELSTEIHHHGDGTAHSPMVATSASQSHAQYPVTGLQRVLDGPYMNGNPDLLMKRYPPGRAMGKISKKGRKSEPLIDGENEDSDAANPSLKSVDDGGLQMRSKTMPPCMNLNRPKIHHKMVIMNGDRLQKAKDISDRAMKMRKVFTIQGGYAPIRHGLRQRGWVEKFYKLQAPVKTEKVKKLKSSDDDDDDGDDDDDDCTDDDDDNDMAAEPKISPWDEEDGLYGIMSRMVRNVNPTFIWVLRRDAVDYKFLQRDQMINHYCKAGSFTTKVGLCINMRNVPWYETADPETFFPRCYRLSHDDDKDEFIDDYRLTSCMSLVKAVVERGMSGPAPVEETDAEKSDESEKSDVNSEGKEDLKNKDATSSSDDVTAAPNTPRTSRREKPAPKKKPLTVPIQALETAVSQCQYLLQGKEHEDIDCLDDSYKTLSDADWDEQLQWYYQVTHDNGYIENIPAATLAECETLMYKLQIMYPQFDADGTKNVWIVKPGAKSRGRGITCYNKLGDMLGLVSSQMVKKEGKYVVQKYIERPLLIYNTKFDIRQWFLVTDWNPLTLWFYKDSYIRLCSQEYTLDKFDESIHLSNNAIQKNYKNGPRSDQLPKDNMWTHEQFKDFLQQRNQGHKWEELIYPGMKKAVTCALLATQDLVEYRKSSFELYGADFMLTEDLHPWLIEINSSPSMESSTPVTAKLCTNVLEDTIKVVLDRKFDKNCDVGAFELAYKQAAVTTPPYIGLLLGVEGVGIRKPYVPSPPTCKKPAVVTAETSGDEEMGSDTEDKSEDDEEENNANETREKVVKPVVERPTKPVRKFEKHIPHKPQEKVDKRKVKSTPFLKMTSLNNSGKFRQIGIVKQARSKSAESRANDATSSECRQRDVIENKLACSSCSSGDFKDNITCSHNENLSDSHNPDWTDANTERTDLCNSAHMIPHPPLQQRVDPLTTPLYPPPRLGSPTRRFLSRQSVANSYPYVANSYPSVAHSYPAPALNINSVHPKTEKSLQVTNVDSSADIKSSHTSRKGKYLLDFQPNSFPIAGKIRRQRKLGRVRHRPEVMIKFSDTEAPISPRIIIKLPQVPYANVNVTSKSNGVTKLKYFNMTQPALANGLIEYPARLATSEAAHPIWLDPYL